MANIRVTGSAILESVNQVAVTATTLVTSINTGAKMLNRWVEHTYEIQQKDLKIAQESIEDRLVLKHGMSILQQRQEMHRFLEENPAQRQEAQDILDHLRKALA